MDKLDELDYAILKLLIQDAKTPYTEIGKRLNVSSGTVHVRMRKLEQAGIVTGATLAINHEELGLKLCAFLGIDLVRDDMHDVVVEKLKAVPQILEAYFTSGTHPILAKIVCHDNSEFSEVLKTQIYPIDGISNVEVFITLAEYFSRSVEIVDQVS
jgi:Lrp/AsnC family transcriptional regulator for asnA, asnC and gidA